MKKIVLSILIIAPYFIACSNGNPTSWNTNLVEVYNRTLDDIEDFQELISLETIGDSTVNRHVSTAASYALTNIDKAIKEFSEGEIPTNAELCQKAAIEMFESAKEQLNIGLKFTHFTEETSEAEVEKYAEEYDAASALTAEKANKFLKEQKNFAKLAGIDKK